MRKIVIASAALIFLLCGIFNVNAIQKQAVKPQEQQKTMTVPKTYQVKLPDLKVELKLTIGKHDYPDAGICDTINGDYTVTNIGIAPSGKYWIMIRSKDTTWGWHDFGSYPLPSLMPGQSKTGNCGIQLRRCPDDDITVGFNVTVDNRHEIKESNENNNTVEKLYPSFGSLKKQPFKTRKLN
jgi:hypothetical protein